MEKILDKFLRYVAVDTMSDPDSPSQPSTQKQFNLLNLLCEELKAMGVENVSVDQYGYLMATIPSNIEKDIPAIGFAINVDAVAKVAAKKSMENILPVSDAIVYAQQGFEAQALLIAQELRDKGEIVENALFDDINLVREYAKEKNISKIIIVDENNRTEVL